MATRVIDDSKLNNIAAAIQAKDSGGQMTVDEMPGRIEAIPSGATLISKTITENGVYNASSDNADGYDVVTVDVPKQLETFLLGNLRYLKTNASYIPIINWIASTQTWLLNIEFMSFNNNIRIVPSNFMRSTDFVNYLKYINLGAPTGFGTMILFAQIGVKTIIIKNKNNVIALNDLKSFDPIYRGIGYLYIPDLDINGNNLVQQYHSSTNWSACADRIKGFSEAPSYDNATTYEIGDVCKYNGKFYGYCKEDLTSSTGNPPTGTTADNDYWEYVADIEVI